MNGPKIIKGMSRFIEFWKKLCEKNITRRIRDTHKLLIAYWDRIRLAFLTLGVETHMT